MTTQLNQYRPPEDTDAHELEQSRQLFLLARAQLAANRADADAPYMNSATASPRAAADS
jgi:hypothetical protein